jgi:hypothetical protein
MTIRVGNGAADQSVQLNIKWVHVIAAILIICSTAIGGMWWLIGARTEAVLNDEFWASERIRPAMRLYIAEKTVSREEFAVFTAKWQISIDKIEIQLNEIKAKLEALNTKSAKR